ncbi:MAG TPA: hypothetical protein VGP14_12225 [Casimicrobiaceae bacterium]|nr:hypothetical protein [Casimicrobiaceae bacterium]
MPSRRDLLKATGGLVLATGGSWLARHAHGADAILGPPELPEGMLSLMNRGDAEVVKMIKAYGAPISDADAKEIVDYLSKDYGQPQRAE